MAKKRKQRKIRAVVVKKLTPEQKRKKAQQKEYERAKEARRVLSRLGVFRGKLWRCDGDHDKQTWKAYCALLEGELEIARREQRQMEARLSRDPK